MFLKGLRFFCRFILKIIARVDIEGFEKIPDTGGVLIVSNHLGRMDAMLGVVLTDRDDIILMIADKYEIYAFWHYLGNKLNAIWLNREEADLRTLREVLRRLKAGGISGMAPEGTRSQTESLLPGKPGAAYLAARTGVPVIPVAMWGTEDRLVKAQLSRFKRLDIKIRIGDPFVLPPLKRKQREIMLQEGTEEMMCQIASMLPESYRGVYTTHPRTLELLEQSEMISSAEIGD
ncbi:MAG: 1-acyl-sn-glycerol-3-phosphate acyltransferase [Chloroflexi bacterium]|nr:1-acyl-sn-glycerol-3-phosphate acyltransferase [Chloroflexota bacterium]